MKKKYLEAGQIVATYGIKGKLCVNVWCDSPAFLQSFKRLYLEEGGKKITILSSKPHKKNMLIIQIDGVNSVTEGYLLQNKVLYIDRESVTLPKGRHFIQDLIGIEVYDVDHGTFYGILTEVFQTGANDIYQITKGKNYLIPVISDVIIQTDEEQNKMFIRPIQGIFENEN